MSARLTVTLAANLRSQKDYLPNGALDNIIGMFCEDEQDAIDLGKTKFTMAVSLMGSYSNDLMQFAREAGYRAKWVATSSHPNIKTPFVEFTVG